MTLKVDTIPVTAGPFRLGEWTVDPRLNRLTRDGEAIQIELKMMDVLVCLAEHAGELVERQALIDTVWAIEFIAENTLTRAIAELRNVLGDDAKHPSYIETIHRRGYRLLQYPQSVEQTPASRFSRSAAELILEEAPTVGRSRTEWRRLALFAAPIAALAIAAGLWMLSENSVLEEADTILLTDFVNRTGDPIFSGTLKQALAVKLEESPFLNVISDQRIRETLRLMDRDSDEAVSAELGREVCQRLNLKAMILGEISPLGRHYVITLNAVQCGGGDSLAREQIEATAKENLLSAMDRATANLRRKLGESLRSIDSFDTPLMTAATPSLEALKSYSVAKSLMNSGRYLDSLPYALRAVEIDPGFARAYNHAAICYWNGGDREAAREWATGAFINRDRASESFRLAIDAFYYRYVTGELDKALDAFLFRNELYPGQRGLTTIANIYHSLGELEKALGIRQELLQVKPERPSTYSGLAESYIALNRVEEARQVLSLASARGFDNRYMRMQLFRIAFREDDATAMEEQLRWSSGGPHERRFLAQQARFEALGGRLRKSRELTGRCRDLAEHFDSASRCSSSFGVLALSEAHAGMVELATEDAETAAAYSRSPGTTANAARALALVGMVDRAGELADELEKSWPLDTLVNSVHVPAIRAEIALFNGDSEGAVKLVRNKRPYENSWCAIIEIRGRALLRSGAAREATSEFRRLLDLRPRWSRVDLWLGRSLAAAGDSEGAKESYEVFLGYWSDADPDAPLLLQVLAEYDRLTGPPA